MSERGESRQVRDDLSEWAENHYRDLLGDVPVLAVNDRLRLPDDPATTYVVLGFRAGGMLVDVERLGITEPPLCVPRLYVPLRGDGGFLVAAIGGQP